MGFPTYFSAYLADFLSHIPPPGAIQQFTDLTVWHKECQPGSSARHSCPEQRFFYKRIGWGRVDGSARPWGGGFSSIFCRLHWPPESRSPQPTPQVYNNLATRRPSAVFSDSHSSKKQWSIFFGKTVSHSIPWGGGSRPIYTQGKIASENKMAKKIPSIRRQVTKVVIC